MLLGSRLKADAVCGPNSPGGSCCHFCRRRIRLPDDGDARAGNAVLQIDAMPAARPSRHGLLQDDVYIADAFPAVWARA